MARDLKNKWSEWERLRDKAKQKMYNIATNLENAHSQHQETKLYNAKSSLFSSVVGLGGVLLAPFSGGASLVASAAATGLSAKSLWSDHQSGKLLSVVTDNELRNAERVMREFDLKSNEILEISKIILNFETTAILFDVRDSIINLSISKYELSYRKHEERVEGGFFRSTQNCTATVTNYARSTESVMDQMGCCVQVLNAAKSINKMSAPVHAVHLMSLPNGAHMLTDASRHVGFEGVGLLSRIVTHSAKSSPLSIKGALKVRNGKETIKAAINARKASQTTRSARDIAVGSDKVLRTTVFSKTAKETSKVSGTITKAASISKVGVALSAIVIPLEIYNIVTINNSMRSTPENVKKLRDEADKLGDYYKRYEYIFETFEQMHMEVFKVYEEHHIDKLYEFLVICHRKLNLKLPTKFP